MRKVKTAQRQIVVRNPSEILTHLLDHQKGLCFFCAQVLPAQRANVEHLYSKSRGGDNSIENCVACCIEFNSSMADASVKDKMVLIQSGIVCPANLIDRTPLNCEIREVPIRLEYREIPIKTPPTEDIVMEKKEVKPKLLRIKTKSVIGFNRKMYVQKTTALMSKLMESKEKPRKVVSLNNLIRQELMDAYTVMEGRPPERVRHKNWIKTIVKNLLLTPQFKGFFNKCI